MDLPKQALYRALRRAIHMAMAASPALAIADTPLYSTPQWQCAADARGLWVCQLKDSTPGPYPPANRLVEPVASGADRTAVQAVDNPYRQWDWQPMTADELQACGQPTACGGAYVEPPRDWPEAGQAPEQSPTRVKADHSSMVGNVVEMAGSIQITRGSQQIRAENATLDRVSGDLSMTGNIEYREPGVLLRSTEAELNTETGLGQFQQVKLVHHASGNRATAESAARTGPDNLTLNDASYTQCTPASNVWQLNASEIDLDYASGWGKAKHARLNIQSVPVFYSPYLTFPIDDRRKSGFLWPSISSTDNSGIDFSVPYYLNLAPNYDATITPRYINNRGNMAEAELRYLNGQGDWQLAGAHLTNDEQTDTDRWLGNLLHQGSFRNGLTSHIEYTEVSDNDYFKDLTPTSLEAKRQTHLLQEAGLDFVRGAWRSSLAATQYQTIDEDIRRQYKQLPQLTIENSVGDANFAPDLIMLMEATSFDHQDSIAKGGTFVTGERFYSEAGVSYPMNWIAGFIVPTVKMRHLDYRLDDTTGDDSPDATVSTGTLDMGLFFEREMAIGDTGFIQTLEPRLFYWYSDYEEQPGYPNFDTSKLDFSTSQLFRDTRFNGHDRLDDANQVSVGLTSRFIKDETGEEMLSLSAGQIFYFEDRRIDLTNTVSDENQQTNSEIVGEVQFRPSESLWFSSNILWDSRQDYVNEGGFITHFTPDKRQIYNLGYRYRRDGITLGEVRNLEQIDSSLSVPLAERWSLYARYQYDLTDHRSLVDMAGIAYEDCCWMVRLVYQRSIDNEFLEPDGNIAVEREHVMLLQFQLKGLGGLGSKASSILQESILGYEDIE